MPRRRRRAWVGFLVFAILAIAGLFVVHGAASGAVLLAAFLAFLLACIYALRGQSRDSVAQTQRTGFTGWIGGWW
jgi:hypothetical protein